MKPYHGQLARTELFGGIMDHDTTRPRGHAQTHAPLAVSWTPELAPAHAHHTHNSSPGAFCFVLTVTRAWAWCAAAVLGSLAMFMVTALFALSIHACITLPLMLRSFSKSAADHERLPACLAACLSFCEALRKHWSAH